MAITTTIVGRTRNGGILHRHSDVSGANAILALTVPLGGGRLIGVFCKYSAVPVQAGVTTELDSGVGAAYDTTLNTGAANAQSTAYQPVNDLVIGEDDAIRVTAPAGGGVITSQISIYTETPIKK